MQLDLSGILAHLRRQHPRLSDGELAEAEAEYQNFLMRGMTCPELCVMPETLASLLWQAHAGQR